MFVRGVVRGGRPGRVEEEAGGAGGGGGDHIAGEGQGQAEIVVGRTTPSVREEGDVGGGALSGEGSGGGGGEEFAARGGGGGRCGAKEGLGGRGGVGGGGGRARDGVKVVVCRFGGACVYPRRAKDHMELGE